jgi:hypothetical protein
MPPQPATPPTLLPPNDQLNCMLGQLAWCMAGPSPIKNELEQLGLDPESAKATIQALSSNAVLSSIAQLRTTG